MCSSTLYQSFEAFQTGVAAWAAYTASPAGQLRNAEILRYLQAHLGGPPRRILDAGCGTGEIGASLAREGHAVTMLDFSPAMLDEARRHWSGPRVHFVCGDANRVAALFGDKTFDVVLCHSLLEFVDNPASVLAQMAAILAPGGILSVVVGNRYHTALREAVVRLDFGRARRELDRETRTVDIFGLLRHTFAPEALKETIEAQGLMVIAEYGVRVFADLLSQVPPQLDDLLALELAAGARMPYRRIARFVQFLATK